MVGFGKLVVPRTGFLGKFLHWVLRNKDGLNIGTLGGGFFGRKLMMIPLRTNGPENENSIISLILFLII